MQRKSSYYIINSITLYRLIAAPFLLYLVITKQPDIFKWLLAFSFFTDAIDGYLARRYKVVSVLVQVISAFIRYGAITSFHTYLAKLAAILQGSFLILAFFLPEPVLILFYIAVTVTALDLIEEIVLTFILPKSKSNVKGIYWVLKQKNIRLLLVSCGFCLSLL